MTNVPQSICVNSSSALSSEPHNNFISNLVNSETAVMYVLLICSSCMLQENIHDWCGVQLGGQSVVISIFTFQITVKQKPQGKDEFDPDCPDVSDHPRSSLQHR